MIKQLLITFLTTIWEFYSFIELKSYIKLAQFRNPASNSANKMEFRYFEKQPPVNHVVDSIIVCRPEPNPIRIYPKKFRSWKPVLLVMAHLY